MIGLYWMEFSGFDSGAQEVMLSRYTPHDSPLFELRSWYIRSLAEAGQHDLGDIPCKHGRFSNGEPVTKEHRLVYRNRPDLQSAFPYPAVINGDSNCFYNWFDHTWPLERARHPRIVGKIGSPDECKAAVELLSHELHSVYNSFTFRLGRTLMTPWRILRKVWV
jgi:hypothetical protein